MEVEAGNFELEFCLTGGDVRSPLVPRDEPEIGLTGEILILRVVRRVSSRRRVDESTACNKAVVRIEDDNEFER